MIDEDKEFIRVYSIKRKFGLIFLSLQLLVLLLNLFCPFIVRNLLYFLCLFLFLFFCRCSLLLCLPLSFLNRVVLIKLLKTFLLSWFSFEIYFCLLFFPIEKLWKVIIRDQFIRKLLIIKIIRGVLIWIRLIHFIFNT